MAKFKVGDKVSLTGANGESLTGVVADEGDAEGTGRFAVVDIDAECGYHVKDVIRYYTDASAFEQLTLIKPKAPKPKTIPARNLSGKHIGRAVTVTLRSGAEVKAELREVAHCDTDGPTTYVRLAGISPQGMFDPFALDPDSKVTLS